MDERDFWCLIASLGAEAEHDRVEALVEALAARPPDDITAFADRLAERLAVRRPARRTDRGGADRVDHQAGAGPRRKWLALTGPLFHHRCMADTVMERRGVPVLMCDPGGPPIATVQDAVDVIGAAFGQADVVAVPADRLDEGFFTLRTGLAGEIMQKFVNYRTRLVVVGDIARHVAASTALRDLVRESNKGGHVWFVADLDELDRRLD